MPHSQFFVTTSCGNINIKTQKMGGTGLKPSGAGLTSSEATSHLLRPVLLTNFKVSLINIYIEADLILLRTALHLLGLLGWHL